MMVAHGRKKRKKVFVREFFLSLEKEKIVFCRPIVLDKGTTNTVILLLRSPYFFFLTYNEARMKKKRTADEGKRERKKERKNEFV